MGRVITWYNTEQVRETVLRIELTLLPAEADSTGLARALIVVLLLQKSISMSLCLVVDSEERVYLQPSCLSRQIQVMGQEGIVTGQTVDRGLERSPLLENSLKVGSTFPFQLGLHRLDTTGFDGRPEGLG